MTKFFKAIYRVIDKCLIIPISRLVFNIQKLMKKNGKYIDMVLNRQKFLLFLSLVLALMFFVLIDRKALKLVNTDSDIITSVPVELKYNAEAYIVEGVPETVDITITGRKSEIYLAKQLGEFKVTLDLSGYSASDSPYKAYFTYSKNVDRLNYRLDPSYVSVIIRNKVSTVSSVTHEIINQDKLDSKLSVKSVALSKNEVVVKASEQTLSKIAWIKALVDLNNPDLTEAGSYDIDNVALVAYDNEGKILENVEIVPNTLSATIVLDSYSTSIPIEVKTSGDLIAGKSIASILVNNKSDYTITAYGSEAELSQIKSIPVVVKIDNSGSQNTETRKVTLTKPNGVRYMSDTTITLSITYGDEQQKTIEVSNISPTNLGEGLKANIISTGNVSVICKGVSSVLENIDAASIQAYVDLTGLNEGDHEVEVKIDNNNPLIKYVVSSKITVRISKD